LWPKKKTNRCGVGRHPSDAIAERASLRQRLTDRQQQYDRLARAYDIQARDSERQVQELNRMVRQMQRRITDVGRSLEVGMVTPPRSRGESRFETPRTPGTPSPVSRRLFESDEYDQGRSYERSPSSRAVPRRLTHGEQEPDRQDRALVVSTAAKPRQREQQPSSSPSAWESTAFDVRRERGQDGYEYRPPSKPSLGVNQGSAQMPSPMREMERYESRGYGRERDTGRREAVSGGQTRRDYDSEF